MSVRAEVTDAKFDELIHQGTRLSIVGCSPPASGREPRRTPPAAAHHPEAPFQIYGTTEALMLASDGRRCPPLEVEPVAEIELEPGWARLKLVKSM